MRLARAVISFAMVAGACSIDLAPLEEPPKKLGPSGTAAKGGNPGFGGFGGGGGTFDASGGVGAGGVGAAGGAGGAPPVKNPSCDAFCKKAVGPTCHQITEQQCVDYCNGHFQYYARCAAEYQAYVNCGIDKAVFQCVDGYYEESTCEGPFNVFVDCTFEFSPSCVNSPAPSLGSCYAAAGCNPVLNDSCKTGEVCSWSGDGQFDCYPGDYYVPVCQPCDYATNDLCLGGYECIPFENGVCAKYCCEDGDCPPGSKCLEVGYFLGTKFCGAYLP